VAVRFCDRNTRWAFRNCEGILSSINLLDNIPHTRHDYCYTNMSKLTISQAAELRGVSTKTQAMEAEGKLIPERTASGHRRYDLSQLLGVKPELSLQLCAGFEPRPPI